MDPLSYPDRMAKIPKMVFVASNDEFMMFEWTNFWWKNMTGEKYLLVNANTEHTELTGIAKALNGISWFINHVRKNESEVHQFDSSFDYETGELKVTVAENSVKPWEVRLRTAETLTDKRRDFRWMILGDKENPENPCPFPLIKMPKDHHGDPLCIQPIFWDKHTAE